MNQQIVPSQMALEKNHYFRELQVQFKIDFPEDTISDKALKLNGRMFTIDGCKIDSYISLSQIIRKLLGEVSGVESLHPDTHDHPPT